MMPAPGRPLSKKMPNSRTTLAIGLLFGLVATTSWAGSWVGVGRSMKEDTRSVAFGKMADNVTIYAFSGHKHYGVFKTVSTDNGQNWGSWQPTPLNEYKIFSLATGATASVNVVVAHPDYRTTPLVLAGTDTGMVYRSTNHGASWVAATGLPANTQIMDIAFANGGIVACTWGNGVYRSGDGGATFQAMPTIFGSTSRVMKADPLPFSTTEFFVVTATNGLSSGGVYRWNGSGWTNLSASLPGWGTTVYSFSSVRAVDPPEPVGPEVPNPKLWVGDMNGNGLLASNDLGASWFHTCLTCEIVTWLSAAPDYDAANEHMLVGTSWGWYEHILGGAGLPCQRRFPKGLAINSITADPNWSASRPILWLGTSDGIRHLSPGGFPSPPKNDDEISSFDISFLQSSPNSQADGSLYGVSKQFGIFRSLDRGASFHQYMPSLDVASTATSLPTTVTAVATYPTFSGGSCNSNGATLFMATSGAGVYRSTAAGSDWAPINNGLPQSDQNLCFLLHTPIASTTPLFAGACNQARVFVYTGGTSSWSPTSAPLNGSKITALALSPNFNGVTDRVLFAGTDVGLYRSMDAGATWTQESLPGSGPITALALAPNYSPGNGAPVFAARGASLYRFSPGPPGWQQVLMTPGGEYTTITALAASPDWSTDQGIAAAAGNPVDGNSGGVYISRDMGLNWTITPNPPSLSERQVKSMAVVKRITGLRLVVGTNRRRTFYSDDPFQAVFSGWIPSTGFESFVGEIRAVERSPALTNIGCTMNSPNEEGSDIFIGGTAGVFWSNDGGETYRPINQWWDKSNDWTCPPAVNALYAFINPMGPQSNEKAPPMLLAGTSTRGIWYRYATIDPATGAWDWTQGQWVQSNLEAGDVNRFTRERGFTPIVLRAATNTGTWESKSPLITGEQWSFTGMPGGGAMTYIANGQVPAAGVKAPNQPDAPGGSATWGTVNNSGVWKGIEGGGFAGEATTAITWTERNGSGAGLLENMNTRSVIQLSDNTLLCGTMAGGVYRSEDEGVTWWEAAATALGGLGKPVTDFLESTNGDVLCAVDSRSTGGGVFLSGDKGNHWASISDGFDSSSQSLSNLIASTDTPPAYYAGTYTHGSYATTITAADYPTISSLSVTTGSASGGTAVTVTGTGFQSACPSDYTCPDSAPVVVFGGVDATATFVSSTQLTVTTPAHPGGAVEVWVRNPDTRTGQYTGTFTFTEVEGGSPEFKVTVTRDISNRVVVTWENAPGSGTRKIFRSPTLDFSRRVTTITSSGANGSYTFTDTTGTDDYTYYYKVE